MEVRDQNGDGRVDNGFGTFIVYSKAPRQLSHQAVDPIADSDTNTQAVSVFKATDSRSFLMAGAHRDANAARSACLPDRLESDASHNANTMVQATNEELLAYYGAASWFAIQWHGMADETCLGTDVYLSHGLNVKPAPTDKIKVLCDKLALPPLNWKVGLPKSDFCNLDDTYVFMQAFVLHDRHAVCREVGRGFFQSPRFLFSLEIKTSHGSVYLSTG
jgi:hypothetical protein